MSELSFTCPGCGTVTEIDEATQKRLMGKLDPKYPAKTAIINCRCGEYQFNIATRMVRRDSDRLAGR